MRKLAKASATFASAQAVAIVFKAISTKFLAMFLGPYGLGVFSQLGFFFNWVVIFGSLGSVQGIVKYVSEYFADDKHQEIKKIYVTLGAILFFLSILLSLGTYLFSSQITRLLLDDLKFEGLVKFLPFSFPQAVMMMFFIGIVHAFRPVKQISFFKVADAFQGIVIMVPLVYFFNLTGAAFNIIVMALVQLGLIYWVYHKYVPVKFSLKELKLFEIKSIYKVLNYGTVQLIVQLVSYLVLNILFRRLIITHLGVEANGLYSPAYGLSLHAMYLIQSTIFIYSFTKVSEARDNNEVILEVNNLLRVALLIMTPVLFLFTTYRRLLILLLYTDKFLPVTAIMPVQFLGDFFKVIGWSVALPISARAKLKAMLVFDVGINIVFYLLVNFLIPYYGLQGAVFSYLSMYVIYCFIVYFYNALRIGFGFERQNVILIILSLVLLLIAGIIKLPGILLVIASIVLLAGWGLIVLSKEEIQQIWVEVVNIGARIKGVF